jgi:hypothetical protein
MESYRGINYPQGLNPIFLSSYTQPSKVGTKIGFLFLEVTSAEFFSDGIFIDG